MSLTKDSYMETHKRQDKDNLQALFDIFPNKFNPQNLSRFHHFQGKERKGRKKERRTWKKKKKKKG